MERADATLRELVASIEGEREEKQPDSNENRIYGENETTRRYRKLDNDAAKKKADEDRYLNQDPDRR